MKISITNMTFATKIKKMKMYTRLLPIFLLLFGFVSVNAQIKKMGKLQQGVHMTFDQESIALGDIKKGEKRTFDFFFTNTGTDLFSHSLWAYRTCFNCHHTPHFQQQKSNGGTYKRKTV